jgi:hypothetical protein
VAALIQASSSTFMCPDSNTMFSNLLLVEVLTSENSQVVPRS